MTDGTSTTPRAGRKEWIGLAVIALACVLYVMDLTVLHLAVPAISADLRPSSTELLWIIDIYGFLVAGSLITMGTLGDRIGRRRLLMIGAAAFGVASLAAAFSTSAGMLIASRALMGVAGATLAPSTLSLIFNMFTDPKQRSRAIGVWIASFSAGGRVLPEFRDPDAGRLDLVSTALSLGAILAVIYGLKQTAVEGFGTVPALSILAGLALALVFVHRQVRIPDPMIDLRLFRIRVFSASLTTYMLSIFVAFGYFLFVAQYLQLVLGLSPLEAGLWALPPGAGVIVGSLLAPLVFHRFRPAVVMGTGLLIAAGALLALTQVGGPASLTLIVVSVGVMALALAPVITLSTELVVGSAPPERAGAASGISETSAELGGALGIAVLGSIGTAIYRADMAPGIPEGVPAAAAAIAAVVAVGVAILAASMLRGIRGRSERVPAAEAVVPEPATEA